MRWQALIVGLALAVGILGACSDGGQNRILDEPGHSQSILLYSDGNGSWGVGRSVGLGCDLDASLDVDRDSALWAASPSFRVASATATAPVATPLAAGSSPQEGVVESVATWYGADYHGNFMACPPWERYDMEDPTITASTWYPCNTWLRVCHEDRCIEVVVRDTGLFSHAVDLSRAAFEQLAPLGAGVIPVTVEVME